MSETRTVVFFVPFLRGDDSASVSVLLRPDGLEALAELRVDDGSGVSVEYSGRFALEQALFRVRLFVLDLVDDGFEADRGALDRVREDLDREDDDDACPPECSGCQGPPALATELCRACGHRDKTVCQCDPDDWTDDVDQEDEDDLEELTLEDDPCRSCDALDCDARTAPFDLDQKATQNPETAAFLAAWFEDQEKE